MVERLIAERLHRSRKSLLLLGPRQVGKSTLCRTLKPVCTINLADEREFLRFSKDPQQLEQELAALRKPGLIFIDEVQRVPALLNTVQMILDKGEKGLRFLLTGSSARKLRRGGVNLLPGRVILEYLDPLSCLELEEPLDLRRALQVGMLPGIYLGDEESVDVLETYVEVYLREEIRAEALTKNVGGYARFLDVTAVLSGSWLNYSKISSDTEIPKETVRRFVALLEDTLLLFRIPPFHPKRKISRRISQREKILLFDVGVRNSLLDLHRRPITQDQMGTVFEQWFSLQVIGLVRALKKGWNLSSYRTESGAEVDLVLERDSDIVAIEIKASRNVGPADLRGLQSLEQTVGRYKPVRKRVAALVDRRRRLENRVEVVPYLDLLKDLRDDRM